MECRCLRCGRNWSSRVERPASCRWCKSPYWDKPIARSSVSEASKRRASPDDPETHAEDIATAYAPTVLEHAAKAEAPIGRSVTEFLMQQAPKISSVSPVEPQVTTDEWEVACIDEFGSKALTVASKNIPRWDRLNWKQRHETLIEKREREQGDAW